MEKLNTDVAESDELRKLKEKNNQLKTSILLLLIAIVSVTAATVAWFSIADHTRVQSMDMEVTSGLSLRFDLDPHDTFDEYIKTLTFAEISQRIKRDKGFDMEKTPLNPVTTADTVKFTYENGTVSDVKSGDYLEFTLNFRATKDMYVHLTSADGNDGASGTMISSHNEGLPKAMRISFTIGDETFVYDPGMADESTKSGQITTFGLPSKSSMNYNENNSLFFIKADENLPVVVHIWLEGTDEACTDSLRGNDYSIAMRFVGTDKDGNLLTEEEK